MVSSRAFTNNALGVSLQLFIPSPKKEKEEKHHYIWVRGKMVGEKLSGLGVWTGKPGWWPVAVINTPGARALPGSPGHPTGSVPCLRVKSNPGREEGFLA